MSTPPTHILWLDLETTGTDRQSAEVIEVAVALTQATPELRVIEAFSTPLIPHQALWQDGLNEEVRRMHTRNGLIADIEAGKAMKPWSAELRIRDILKRHVPDTRKVPLGGSGVGHFDRDFVNREFPLIAKRLTYWPIDVGVVRRMCQMAGVDLPKAPDKTHRSMDCVHDALVEARHYLRLLSGPTSVDYDPDRASDDEFYALGASLVDAARPGLL